MEQIVGSLKDCYKANSQLYRFFTIGSLELLLFSKGHFSGSNSNTGDVCTKVYGTDQFVTVGTWQVKDSQLKFSVFQLGYFISEVNTGYAESPVYKFSHSNPLNKLAEETILRQDVQDNTELSLFILTNLFKD